MYDKENKLFKIAKCNIYNQNGYGACIFNHKSSNLVDNNRLLITQNNGSFYPTVPILWERSHHKGIPINKIVKVEPAEIDYILSINNIRGKINGDLGECYVIFQSHIIDPDGLNALFEPAEERAEVMFHNYYARVKGRGVPMNVDGESTTNKDDIVYRDLNGVNENINFESTIIPLPVSGISGVPKYVKRRGNSNYQNSIYVTGSVSTHNRAFSPPNAFGIGLTKSSAQRYSFIMHGYIKGGDCPITCLYIFNVAPSSILSGLTYHANNLTDMKFLEFMKKVMEHDGSKIVPKDFTCSEPMADTNVIKEETSDTKSKDNINHTNINKKNIRERPIDFVRVGVSFMHRATSRKHLSKVPITKHSVNAKNNISNKDAEDKNIKKEQHTKPSLHTITKKVINTNKITKKNKVRPIKKTSAVFIPSDLM